jgi:hypothetical protein
MGKGWPKKHVSKNLQRGKYKAKCDHRQLQDTLLEVKNGTMSERAAAKACGVSPASL